MVTVETIIQYTHCNDYLISLLEFNLPLRGFLSDSRRPGLTEPRPVGGGNYLWITCILFWPHKDTKGLRDEESSQCRAHLRDSTYMKDDTPGTGSVISIRGIWNDYGGQMIFGDLSGHKVSWHLPYRWRETLKKSSPRKPGPTGDRTRSICVTCAHATACSTSVDCKDYYYRRWTVKSIIIEYYFCLLFTLIDNEM